MVQLRRQPHTTWGMRDVWRMQCRAYAIAATGDVGKTRCRQGRKRAFGVAKRLREISSDQARRKKAYFFRKREKVRKT